MTDQNMYKMDIAKVSMKPLKTPSKPNTEGQMTLQV